MTDQHDARVTSGLQKVAGRTRTLFESLTSLLAIDIGSDLRSAFGDGAASEPAPRSGVLTVSAEAGGEGRAGPRPLAGRKPCIGLFGEFSAGKSSLANLLIGGNLLPTSVLSSTRLPTRLHHAETLTVTTVAYDGARELVALDQVRHLTRDNVHSIEIGLPSPILQAIDILDTPGFADPYHDPQLALDVAAEADIAIWCTLASQAWRQTEQFTWKSLPPALRETGILAVTHADALASEADRAQLQARLRDEAGPWFRDIVLLAVTQASEAVDPACGRIDDGAWERSGAAGLLERLDTALDRLSNADAPSDAEEPGGSAADSVAPIADSPAAGPDSAPKTVDDVLADALSGIPECRIAACVDIDAARSIAVATGATAQSASSLQTHLAALSAAMLKGESIDAIQRLGTGQAGAAPVETDRASELTIKTKSAVYLLLRLPGRQGHALSLLCGKDVNTSLALVKARRFADSLDRMLE
ncbi:MAG: dynamin family protein [Alphaproteobacteria bacterium]